MRRIAATAELRQQRASGNGEIVLRRKADYASVGRITLSLSSGRPKPDPVANPPYVASDVARVERQRNPGAVAGLTTCSRISLSVNLGYKSMGIASKARRPYLNLAP